MSRQNFLRLGTELLGEKWVHSRERGMRVGQRRGKTERKKKTAIESVGEGRGIQIENVQKGT